MQFGATVGPVPGRPRPASSALRVYRTHAQRRLRQATARYRQFILNVPPQGLTNRSEGQIFPGDVTFLEQTDLKTFDSRGEVEVDQTGSVKEVNLFALGWVSRRLCADSQPILARWPLTLALGIATYLEEPRR